MGRLYSLNNREVIERIIRLRNKRGQMVPFRFNKAQEHYWQKRGRRNLVLKARQKGISKMIDADQLIDCIRKATKAIVVSHESEATKRLFEGVRSFVENMRKKPTMSIDSKREIQFPMRGSSYFVGTAGQKAFGRGDTLQRAHLSEAAFYSDLERILAGVEEATEYGQIDIETTPNGREQFYDMWQKAKSGRSSYTTIFIPWFIDGEYSIDTMTDLERSGLSKSVREMFSIPDDEFRAALEPEERDALARIKSEYGFDLPMGMMKWRRYKLWDKGRIFYQEYPEDDVSCFLTGSGSVFTKIIVDPSRKVPLDDFDNWKASKERKQEIKTKKLYAGMDCAEGVNGGDRHSFSVIEVDGPKAYVIFDYASDEPFEMFDAKMARIWHDFNMVLGIETNSVGLAHVKEMKRLRVRFHEWETTGANRPTMITELEGAYRKAELIESYREGEDELLSMVYTDKKTNASNYRAEAMKNKHDDRVMSRAIAWQIRSKPEPRVSWI